MSGPQVVVMINGELRGPDAQQISVFDRGFLYGDSVFETIRTYGGAPFELDLHLSRLQESARRVFIPLPVDKEQLASEVRQAVDACGAAERYIRVVVTRGQGQLGLDPSLAERATRVILVGPLTRPPDELYAHGAALISYRTQRVTDETRAQGAKVGNYLVSVLAMREVRAAGAHEALIVDANGNVAEGASSNVFMVKEHQLITPGVECGILEGVTRRHVLELASSVGLSKVERPIALEELQAADEVFITSSIREILPAVRIDDVVIGDGKPGRYTRALMSAFSGLTRTVASDASSSNH